MQFNFKKDKYRSKRGDYSRLLDLFCRVCNNKIAIYQKDGPGSLRRLYFDRIFFPKKLADLETKYLNLIPKLKCSSCKEDLGTPYIYKKENRKAFKLYQDAVTRKIRRK